MKGGQGSIAREVGSDKLGYGVLRLARRGENQDTLAWLARHSSKGEHQGARMQSATQNGQLFERPRWDDARAYAHLSTAALGRIAWEFLRRNPDYQSSWRAFTREAELLPEGQWHMVSSANGEHGSLSALIVQRGREWGLKRIVDPGAETAEFEESGARYALPMGRPALPVTTDNPHGMQQLTKWLIVQLDLSLPLNVVEAAAIAAIRTQRKLRIARGVIKPVTSRAQSATKYIEYLRLLDAEAADVGVVAAGAALAPGAVNTEERQRDKRFRAALAAARLLQSEGYRVLPLLQPWRLSVKKK